LRVGGFGEFGEGVEAWNPEGALALEPVVELHEGLGVEVAAADAADLALAEQAGVFEDAEVLADGRHGHALGKGFGELADGEAVVLAKAVDDGASGGVGEGGEGEVEAVGLGN